MVHDIYGPLLHPELFKACIDVGVAYEKLSELTNCLKTAIAALEKSSEFTIRNTVYDIGAPSGEGIQLLNYIAQCECIRGFYSVSSFYANGLYFDRYVKIRTKYVGQIPAGTHLYNPAVFFTIV